MNGKSLFEWNRQYAPTGEEAAAGRWIASRLGQYGLSPEIDPFGTVLVRLGGNGQRILICVPYDQKGLLLTGRYSTGNFFVNLIGRWSADQLVGETGLAAGGASASIRAHTGAENYKAPYNLEVEIARPGIGIGDKVVFPAVEEERYEQGSHLFSAGILDNRAACYAVERALQNLDPLLLDAEVCVAFLALDTCSFRGIMALIKHLRPDLAVSVGCKLDRDWQEGTILINHVGTQYVSDPIMVRRIETAAQVAGLQPKHLFENPPSPGDVVNTADSLAQYGCRTVSISIPVREKDWRSGFVSERCVEGTAQLLEQLITTAS